MTAFTRTGRCAHICEMYTTCNLIYLHLIFLQYSHSVQVRSFALHTEFQLSASRFKGISIVGWKQCMEFWIYPFCEVLNVSQCSLGWWGTTFRKVTVTLVLWALGLSSRKRVLLVLTVGRYWRIAFIIPGRTVEDRVLQYWIPTSVAEYQPWSKPARVWTVCLGCYKSTVYLWRSRR